MMKYLSSALLAAGLWANSVAGSAAADMTIRFVHVKAPAAAVVYLYNRFAPPGVKIDIVGVDVPADSKNALLSGSVDVANAGIGTAISGFANGEPLVVIGAFLNGSINITGRADQNLKTLADLKGKRVGLQAGSTQELVFNARLRQENMSIRDITVVRLTFGEMTSALIRGDIDAFVGTEPSSGIAVTSGAGRVIEYPYSTPMGQLNAALMVTEKTFREKPELVRNFMIAHARASEYLAQHPEAFLQTAIANYGVKPDAMEVAIKNIVSAWKIDASYIQLAKNFAQAMLEAKQIRAVPDIDKLITTSVSDDIAKSGSQKP